MPGSVTDGRSRCGWVIAVAVVCVGCTGIRVDRPEVEGRETLSRDAFRAYAEEVFRRQNRAQSRVMMALPDLEDTSAQEAEALRRAEAEMSKACRPLNRAVAAYRSGDDVGLLAKLGMPEVVTTCERRAIEVERELERITRSASLEQRLEFDGDAHVAFGRDLARHERLESVSPPVEDGGEQLRREPDPAVRLGARAMILDGEGWRQLSAVDDDAGVGQIEHRGAAECLETPEPLA